MTTQPNALRLADELPEVWFHRPQDVRTVNDAAAELRRLHEKLEYADQVIEQRNAMLSDRYARITTLETANAELLEALEQLTNVFHEGQVFPRNGAAGYVESTLEFAEAAIAKTQGEQA